MKRSVLVLSILAAFGVAGTACKKKNDKKPDAPKTDTAAKTAEPTMPTTPTAPVKPAGEAAAAAGDPAPTGEPAATGDKPEELTTGITECDDLIKRYTACAKMTADQKKAFVGQAEGWKAAAATGNEQVKTSTASACKSAAEAADEALKASGC